MFPKRYIPLALFFLNLGIFLSIIYYIITHNNSNLLQSSAIFLLMIPVYHNFLNLVHQASHGAILKNKRINNGVGFISALLSGFTLADFKTTHLQHHVHLGNPQKDPDEEIVSIRPAFFMAFGIWKHDRFFWLQGLWKKQNAGTGYIITRVIQVIMLTVIILNGFLFQWLTFSMAPLLIVGTLNGFFLFYFPHYKSSWEEKMRQKQNNSVWEKMMLYSINVSRIYHEIHHDQVHNISAYFPILQSALDKINGVWIDLTKNKGKKYILQK